MNLRPLQSSDVELVAGWLSVPETGQWLDFGPGHRPPSAALLAVMARGRSQFMRVFTPDESDEPIGVVSLASVDPGFRTAMLWYALGDKRFSGRGCTTRAVSKLLTLGFRELGLHAVNAWAVDANAASVRVLENNRFRYAGRQRRCHYVDGQAHDRLLFDLLADEHVEVIHAGE